MTRISKIINFIDRSKFIFMANSALYSLCDSCELVVYFPINCLLLSSPWLPYCSVPKNSLGVSCVCLSISLWYNLIVVLKPCTINRVCKVLSLKTSADLKVLLRALWIWSALGTMLNTIYLTICVPSRSKVGPFLWT